MKKILFFLSFLVGGAHLAGAQDLDQYKYVQVPEKYDFLKEANEYQLNALTAFLFEREGFEVFYGEDLPEGLDGCEMLKADVKKDSGIFTTKVEITLENCKGAVVFTSKMGSSREKDYHKAYQEALRDAFTSVEALDYSYSEMVAEVAKGEEPRIMETTPPDEAVAEKLSAEKARPVVVAEETRTETSVFRNGTTEYTLQRTASGFDLLKGKEKEKFATLLRSGGGTNYIFSSEKLQGNAYFDAEGDLLVEYFDANTEQLVTVRYQLQE